MATSTMDTESAQLAIALQLNDLEELESSGTVDRCVVRLQREQLELDSGFDVASFEASRRLAMSIAKAVEDDSAIISRSTWLPQIDDATFDRLAILNHSPPSSSNDTEPERCPEGINQTLPSKSRSLKRVRSVTPDNNLSSALVALQGGELSTQSHPVEHSHKKVRGEQVTSGQHPRIPVDGTGKSLIQDPQLPTAEVGGDQMLVSDDKETALTTTIETSPSTADCASCSDTLTTDKFVKAACKHFYCNDCFGQFVEARIQTHDGFPPTCCKLPIPFMTVADNVSAAVFTRYSARQDEIKNATALYCGVRGCGVRIQEDRVDGVRATCAACWRDTCTLCRGVLPRADGRKVRHVCKRDKAREQVLQLAKEEGWQFCYQCGNLVALNFGCHHMICRCKAEFCYRCGTKWKNCACGDYDEIRLETRAARGLGIRAARRVAQRLPPDPRPREQQLAELQQRLQVDCDHNDFTYEIRSREEPGHCEICEYLGWKFILRCDNCRFTACRECHNFHGWNGGEDPWEEFIFGRRYYDDETDDDETDDDGTDNEPVSENEFSQIQDS